MAALITASTGIEPKVIGKPRREIIDMILRKNGLRRRATGDHRRSLIHRYGYRVQCPHLHGSGAQRRDKARGSSAASMPPRLCLPRSGRVRRTIGPKRPDSHVPAILREHRRHERGETDYLAIRGRYRDDPEAIAAMLAGWCKSGNPNAGFRPDTRCAGFVSAEPRVARHAGTEHGFTARIEPRPEWRGAVERFGWWSQMATPIYDYSPTTNRAESDPYLLWTTFAMTSITSGMFMTSCRRMYWRRKSPARSPV